MVAAEYRLLAEKLAARRDGTAAFRSLAIQRTPAFLRIHHRAAGADRDYRGLSRGRGEPERWCMDPLASRHRDRVSDRPLDRRAHWLSCELWRAARQRRQYGEFRLLHGCAHCQGGLGCTQVWRF